MRKMQYRNHPYKADSTYSGWRKFDEAAADRLLATKAVQGFHSTLGGVQLLSGTATMRQSRKRLDGTYQRLTIEEAEKTAKFIKKTIERLLFGNAARRFKKEVVILASLEGRSVGKQLHLHFAIGVPLEKDFSQLKKAFETAIESSPWTEGQRYTDPPAYDAEGWATYITKEYNSILWHQSNFLFDSA